MKDQELQRWAPFTPEFWDNPVALLRRLATDAERLFEEGPAGRFFPRQSRLFGEPRWIPSVDVFEKDGNLVVRADLPGLTKDDVKVEVTDGAITVQGERKKEVEEEREGRYRFERAYGSFYRAVPLPEGVKPDQVNATFKNGVLEVTAPLPPAKKEAKAHRVEVNEGGVEKKTKSAA
jgi:HSP20 family protein